MPENADFEPIRVDLKHEALLIEGVVVGVLRRGAGPAASKPPVSRAVPGKRAG
jgi:hypothetical protein